MPVAVAAGLPRSPHATCLPRSAITLRNRCASLQAVLQAHGGLHSLRSEGLTINLFPASALEAGPANLWLRSRGADGLWQLTPLLGPRAAGRQHRAAGRVWQQGRWQGVAWRAELVLAATTSAWFWHVTLHNRGPLPLSLDLIYVQDLALAPWSAIRLNEAYVSQYLDHQPLAHAKHGWMVATRQNQPVAGRTPWVLSGSLGVTQAYATDALQTLGLARRAGIAHGLLNQPALPSQRLQHEHALVALQDRSFTLAPGGTARRGFYGALQAHHPEASGEADLARVAQVLALPEAKPPSAPTRSARHQRRDAASAAHDDPRSLFSAAPLWPAVHADEAQMQRWFAPGPWREVQRDAAGRLMSFFTGLHTHGVTLAHELRVRRSHGHVLRSGSHLTPDETAVASTVWMAGGFHTSLTQGHASANRVLSTQRGGLGLYRGLGQRVLVDSGSGWHLLDQPSAWAVSPQSAQWWYLDADGACIEVEATASADASPSVALSLKVHAGPALRVLVSHHLPLNSRDGADDGLTGAQPEGAIDWQWLADGCGHDAATPPKAPDPSAALRLHTGTGSDLARRFGARALNLHVQHDGTALTVAGDEALFIDGRSRQQPYLCLQAQSVRSLQLTLRCALIPATHAAPPGPTLASGPQPAPLHWQPAAPGHADAQAVQQLGEWLPWLAHNALVHYLTPRGLEQFSGGGWGTRDVCQGPAELLHALGRFDALRDLLCRVFAAQNPDGDWPQWFMFYPRDAHIRAGDSHGDIVFWPLVALADYLCATGDASLLNLALPFYGEAVARPIGEHVARALAVVQRRRIAGTQLAAYGHGDWNDALQPADPAMREHLCSAWTVTLHYRTLRALATAWGGLGLAEQANDLNTRADAVLADFQRLLVADGVLTGYASFDQGAVTEHLLHPRDTRTGIHFSALAMVHAIVDGLFTPEQAAQHATLIEKQLMGPDGLRLFDRPLAYSGGPMTLFQRGESASFFGREIGLMYMHAHLRWAEALAQLGRADALLHALRLANPIGLESLVPQSAPRQRNCYYSSSDAAFADRAEAGAHYDRIASGEVALEGGWRIYSSGAGIAYRLVLQRLLGLTQQPGRLGLDPVLPQGLDGLVVTLTLYGLRVQVRYQVGPRGHGVLAARLNGQVLVLTPGPHNPYRNAGVWTDAQPVITALAALAAPADAPPELLISLG